jgi:hypothetical protein
VNERDLRNLLLQQPLPDEHLAEERTWDVVRTSFAAREPVPRERRLPWKLVVALGIVAAAIAVGVSSAGEAVADWVRDTLGRERVVGVPGEQRALGPLPVPQSRLLAVAPSGAWVVNDAGGKRRLGDYTGATWSPDGVFVGAWTDSELVAIDPNVTEGGLHWTVSHDGIADARWAPSGFRVAYRADASLRVVVGNGTDDRELAPRVAPVAPAWRPGTEHVLAYADPLGRILVVEADTGKVLWRTARAPLPVGLAWLDAEHLAVLTEQRLRVFRAPRQLVTDFKIPSRLYAATALAARPGTREVAYAVYAERSRQGTVFLHNGRFARPLFSGAGRVDDLVWAPDGSSLLVPWQPADQWLFVAPDDARVRASAEVSSQFDPGGTEGGGFPEPLGWCCADAAP